MGLEEGLDMSRHVMILMHEHTFSFVLPFLPLPLFSFHVMDIAQRPLLIGNDYVGKE